MKDEIIKWVLTFLLAVVSIYFGEPGIFDSPYNDF